MTSKRVLRSACIFVLLLCWVAKSTSSSTAQIIPPGFDALIPDESWDDRFVEPGVNGQVWAIAVDDAGMIFVAGDFTTAGGQPASYIAQWNGAEWSPLGLGLDDRVRALEVTGVVGSGGTLYAGGDFLTAGGAPARHIASWDGTSWSELGSGTNGRVRALELDESNVLFVGGQFSEAGGVAVRRLARWDGNSWSDVGGGVIGPRVQALAAFGTVDGSGGLYVGGDFENAGVSDPEFENNIALWTGTEWVRLPRGNRRFGIPGRGVQVTNLVLRSDGGLYISGGSGIYEYEGIITKIRDQSASSLQIDENDILYAGFGNGIFVWDGMSWTPLDSEINLSRSLAFDANGDLLAGGNINSASSFPAQNISRWNGTEWIAFGDGVSRRVQAIEVDPSGTLYIGVSGGSIADVVSFWDGSRWRSVGAGLTNGRVEAMDSDDQGNLYAGGSFTSATDPNVNNVAVWNGVEWSGLGSGVTGGVRDLVVDAGGKVFVTGQFLTAGSVPVNGVAMWDGASWQPLGSGIDRCCGGGGFGRALAVEGDVGNGGVLYLGGPIDGVDGVPVEGVAMWDGVNWSPLGDELQRVEELAMDKNGILYAGGSFSVANGQGVARWNGTAWVNIGEVRLFGTTDIAFGETGTVFAGGRFAAGPSSPFDYVAQWDGEEWSGLDGGTNNRVEALATSGDNVFAGGGFTEAGGAPSWYIGRWKSGPKTETETFLVTEEGLLPFPTAQVELDLQDLSGSGLITITRVNNTPTNPDGIIEPTIAPYRVLVETDGFISPGEGTQVRFPISSLDGFTDPSRVRVYKRDTPGSGPFTDVTAANSPDGEYVIADASSFSEFAFAVEEPDPPLVAGEAFFRSIMLGSSPEAEFTGVPGADLEGLTFVLFDAITEVAVLAQPLSGSVPEDGLFNVSIAGSVPNPGALAVLRPGVTVTPGITEITDLDTPDSPTDFTSDVVVSAVFFGSEPTVFGVFPEPAAKGIRAGGIYAHSQTNAPAFGDGVWALFGSAVPSDVPTEFALGGNVPNPVTAGTRIEFRIPEPGPVRLEVFDSIGRKVATLVDRSMPVGTHEVVWPASQTQRLASGLYIYRLQAGSFTQARRLTIVR